MSDTGIKYSYIEDGKTVFTEAYHLRRGHCCGNKCRHCPYWPKYQQGNTKVKNNELRD